MHIHCLGLNHRTAEVGLRERLAFTEDSARAALARLGCGLDHLSGPINELVILSTCNRVELYAQTPDPTPASLEDFLAEVQGTPVDQFRAHLYHYCDQAAVEHLFRVAAGLDSLVLGEPQILGQVMMAFERARSQDAVGAVLSRLFQAALYTGKRARSETSISHNPASISSVAVRLAEQSVADLHQARVGILGAGEMAELAIEALRKRGVQQVVVINRTLERARLLAERVGTGSDGVELATFERMPQVLSQLDVLITSTGAPHTILHVEGVTQAMQGRRHRPLVIIDIAVPRNVDVEVGELFGVHLFDMDTLHNTLQASLARRASEVPQVEAILAEEVQAFLGYLQTLEVTPLIAEMRLQAEAIRQAELEKTLRRMPDLSPEDRQRLEALTNALVKKLLHEPITCLRSEAGSPQAAEYAAAARTLFGLHKGQPQANSSSSAASNPPPGA